MNTNCRHAYLIIAYAQPRMLQCLLTAIDDPRNDIYVHIDQKAAFDGSDLKVRKSNLTILPHPIDARWGDVTLVEVELRLLETALQHGTYAYLHLLSDSDFPIKSQDEIHEECQKLAGTEFIGYAEVKDAEKEIRNKVQYYYFFTKRFRENTFLHRVYKYIYVRAQKYMGIRRSRHIDFKRGSQWCSITGDFAQYVISHRDEIRSTYHRTYCPDEIFIQTLCWSSPFRSHLYDTKDEFHGCKRYINWYGRDIHWFEEKDIDKMKVSDRWFARKFKEEDTDLVQRIGAQLCNLNE
ncbi:MAG: glycosyl transferase [Bacteroidaceae bacterium]|nr:glycosyl transferase [Bacteroidaceae bacterium]